MTTKIELAHKRNFVCGTELINKFWQGIHLVIFAVTLGQARIGGRHEYLSRHLRDMWITRRAFTLIVPHNEPVSRVEKCKRQIKESHLTEDEIIVGNFWRSNFSVEFTGLV